MVRRPPARGVVATVLALAQHATAYTMVPRWGFASAYLPDPPTLIIQGGKTDPTGAYTYTSAPNSADTISIPLNSGFNPSSPPAQLLKANPEGPAYAWHCLCPLGSDNGTWKLLSIGGDGGWDQRSDTLADSAWIASINPSTGAASFTHQPTGWANQPTRRIYHACATPLSGGNAFITGGINSDGSGNTYTATYKFDPGAEEFSTLAPLPVGLYHHSSVLLGNGTLLNFGGVTTSPQTRNPELEPLDKVFVLDTGNPSAKWQTIPISGPAPTPRRGCSATVNPDGTIFIYGGTNVNFSTVYSDGWILNPTTLSWTQVLTPNASPGPRFDHTAVQVGGGQLLVFGGFGEYVPVEAGMQLWIVTGNGVAEASSYTPTPFTSTGNAATAGSSGNGGVNGQSDIGSGGGSANGNGNGNGNGVSGNGSQGGTIGGSVNGNGDGTNPGDSSGYGGSTRTDIPGPTTTETEPGAAHDGLTTASLAGLIVGLGVAILLGVLLFLWARHRHRRKTGRGNDREYTEKGSRGLLADPETPLPPPPGSEHALSVRRREAMAALGVGFAAVGAAAATTARKISGRPEEGYTQLDTAPPPPEKDKDHTEDDDDLPNAGVLGLLRRSTRRIGRGIRLIGVTRSIDDEDEDLPTLQPTAKGKRPRKAMLQDEDTRRFSADRRLPTECSPIPEETSSMWKQDWVLLDPDRSDWRAAESLLGSDTLQPPVIPGGPVPTPAESLRGGPLTSPDPSVLDALQAINPPTPSVFDAFEAEQAGSEAPTTSGPAVNATTAGVAAAVAAALAVKASPMANPFNHSQDSLTPDDAVSTRNVPVGSSSVAERSAANASPTAIPSHLANYGPSPSASSNRLSTHSIPVSSVSSNDSLADVKDATIASATVVSRPLVRSLSSRHPSTAHTAIMFDTRPDSPRGHRPIQNPVLRQVSLLHRISSGIMGRSRGEPSASRSTSITRDLDVRDPAPQPTDWPLGQSHSSSSHHTDEWRNSSDDDYPIPLGSAQRPSITEVGSIRSMGDMHVIQREPSLSSAEAAIEHLDTPDVSSTGHVSPMVTGEVAAPTTVLRPTNPGPHSAVTTAENTPEVVQEAFPTPLLFQSGEYENTPSRPLSPVLIAPLTRVTSYGSHSGLPSPTLAWGAQASPQASPRGSALNLPSLGPTLTISTTGAADLPPSPLLPTAMSPGVGSSDGSHLSLTHSNLSQMSTRRIDLASFHSAGSSNRDHDPTITTSLPNPVLSRSVPTPGPTFVAPGILTPSPQRNVANRRPVHDIVASINRRGGGLPSHFGAATRSVSASPASTTSPTRRYEMARRDPLVISNPDRSPEVDD